MKKLLVCIYVIAGSLNYAKASPDTLLTALAHAIVQAPVYDAAKIKTIEALKKSLYAVNNTSPEHAFALAEQLYEEYKIFNYDSAYTFAGKMQTLALSVNNAQLINRAKLKYAFILLSAGLYRETLDTLKSVNVTACPVPEKAEYFTLMGRYYYDLATYEYDKYHSYNYDITASHYMDTAISYYPGGSFEKNYYTGLKLFKEGRLSLSATYFEKILANIALPAHEFALTASTLSGVYLQNGETEKAIGLLARAAIADIHTSTKETFAIYSLAELLYQRQDVKYASLCIENAIANASFYDARQRKAQVSGILSLIESERIHAIEAQRGLAIQYGIAVTVSLAALAVLIVVIRKQVKKLKRAQEIITRAHTAQQQMNEKLVEANKIKEEYIGYFFKLDSEYFGRLEKLKKTLELKLADRKFEDIRFIVNNIQPKRDKDELLRNFDKVFLRIFPHFVSSFNALFKEEDQIKLLQNDMLNVDLRIFALIRIGITDNEKIAEILEYSVNTIYSYKTRIKNKSLVSNDDFEKRIKEIKSV